MVVNLISNSQFSINLNMNSVERFTNLTFSQLIARAFESDNFYILGITLKDAGLEIVDGKSVYKIMMTPNQSDRNKIDSIENVLYLITEKVDNISKCVFKQFSLDNFLPHMLLMSDTSDEQDRLKIANAYIENNKFSDAINWLLKIVEQKYSRNECGSIFSFKEGISDENILENTVRELYENAAESGDMLAQWNLSLCYSEGIGVKKDEVKGFELCSKASEQGLEKAQSRLVHCYTYGIGVKPNDGKAFEWSLKVAQQGKSSSQCHVGFCYENGIGVEENYSEAIKWFKKSAENGFNDGQMHLALCYEEGIGVEKNEDEAIKWYIKAAENGSMYAQYAIGVRYLKGRGVVRNENKALHYFIQAAQQNHSKSINRLKVFRDNIELKISKNQDLLDLQHQKTELNKLLSEKKRQSRDFGCEEPDPKKTKSE